MINKSNPQGMLKYIADKDKKKDEGDDKIAVKKVCDVIVETWRLQNKFDRIKSDKLGEEERKILEDQFERIDNVLDMHDLKIEDYRKKEYNEDKIAVKKVCDVIVEIWRLQNKFDRIKSDKLGEEERKILEDQFERIDNVLDMHDLKIEDYRKKEYNDNMSVKKILEREEASLPVNQKIISDVYIPEIRYKGKVVRHAEVIVSIGTKDKGVK